jgi:hypothetical protein
MSLSNKVKITRHSNAVAAGTTDITPSDGIDMQNYEGCLFEVAFGAITAGAVTSIEVHTSSDDGVADAYTALLGSSQTVADDDDNKIFVVDIYKPRERYLKLIVDRATQNAVLDGITAIQYEPRAMSTTHDSTTVGGSEIHTSPAEGTA